MRVAAIQLEAELGDISTNLTACERLAFAAGEAGAEWIILPEFFTTGMGFSPKLQGAALPMASVATEFLLAVAKRYGAHVGGSFLCRDGDGHVRNAFVLVDRTGVVGRHDKDEPTLWENCWYTGGSDSGLLDVQGMKVGVALCAEFGRTSTVSRLRGADLIVGGSYTWHAPDYLPQWLGRKSIDRRLFSDISNWAAPFARSVGAPVVEATHCGKLSCRDQLLPISYRCPIGDGAKICRADGSVLAHRAPEAGPGFIVADIEVGSIHPLAPLPNRKWIQPLGLMGEAFWAVQRCHGQAYYQRRVRRAAPHSDPHARLG